MVCIKEERRVLETVLSPKSLSSVIIKFTCLEKISQTILTVKSSFIELKTAVPHKKKVPWISIL